MKYPQENNSFDDLLRNKLQDSSVVVSEEQVRRMGQFLQRNKWQGRVKHWGSLALLALLAFSVCSDWQLGGMCKQSGTARTSVALDKQQNTGIAKIQPELAPKPNDERVVSKQSLANKLAKKRTARIMEAGNISLANHSEVVEAKPLQYLLPDSTPQAGLVMGLSVPLLMADYQQEKLYKSIKNKDVAAIGRVQRFYVGINSALNNTWIYNQNTYGAFGPTELAYALDWGGAWGVQVGARLGKRVWAEVSYNFISQQGQKYKDVIGNQPVFREVSLYYHQVPLLLKIESGPALSRGRKLRSTFDIGFQYAVLGDAVVNDNGTISHIKDRFNKSEISIMTGKSVQVALSKSLAIETSLYAKMSNNINAEQWKPRDNYEKSHNITIGVKLGLLYFLGK